MAADTVYLVSIPFLAAFAWGIYLRISFWLEGNLEDNRRLSKSGKCAGIARSTADAFFSRKLLLILEAVALDSIAGRRIFRENRVRWLMHSLMLWGFLGLMIFDAVEVGYIRSGMGGESVKDLPHMALAFDLLGMMIIGGVAIAVVRRAILRDRQLQNTTEDIAAIVMLALVVVTGFLIEGFRFLMLDSPPEVTRYAFIGRLLSWAGTPGEQWRSIYGFFWYFHMLVSFAFIAYIPFGKFIHLFAGPIVVTLNNLSAREQA